MPERPTTPLDKVIAWTKRFGRRFVVVDPVFDWGKLTMFKTYRNASRNAGERGVVLTFDPTFLPIALADGELDDVHVDHLTELEFCERQIEMWSKRALAAELGVVTADGKQKRSYRTLCKRCGRAGIVGDKSKQYEINRNGKPCSKCASGSDV